MDADYPCALCPGRFESEIGRAQHFAERHPISDPDELRTIVERVHGRAETGPPSTPRWKE